MENRRGKRRGKKHRIDANPMPLPAENPIPALVGLGPKIVEEKIPNANVKHLEIQLQELFPNIDKEVVALLLEENNGDFDKTLDSLFKLSPDVEIEESKEEMHVVEPMVEIEEETPAGYDEEVAEMVLETLAESFVEAYPRFSIGKVKVLLKENNFDLAETQKKLVEEYGEGYLEPFTEEELSLKAKAEVMEFYLNGEKPSSQFIDFYYNNDLQERAMGKFAMPPQPKVSEEFKNAYDKNFPTLPKVEKHSFPLAPIGSDDFTTVQRCFPGLDRQIISYTLNFCSPAEAIEYLRGYFPKGYSSVVKTAPPKISKPVVVEKRVPIPDKQYREIRKDADAYMRMMQIYIKNRQLARATGNTAEVAKFKRLADECYANYLKASEMAKTKVIEQANKHNNQLEKIDLHGLTANEAAEYANETLNLIKNLVSSGDLKTAADGYYTVRIVTGVGKHSAGGKPVLKPMIRQYLKTKGYKFTEVPHHGVFEVKVGNNKGMK